MSMYRNGDVPQDDHMRLKQQTYFVALQSLSTKNKLKLENIIRDLSIYLEALTVKLQKDDARALLITNGNIFYCQLGRHRDLCSTIIDEN